MTDGTNATELKVSRLLQFGGPAGEMGISKEDNTAGGLVVLHERWA